MEQLLRYGKTALITGASSGIGEAFARRCAAAGLNLIIVARRQERLEALAAELSQKHSVQVSQVAIDLGREDSGAKLFEEVASKGLEVDILINNAGFGVLGELEKIELSRNVGMVDLNCRAVVDLTARFLPGMKARKRGAVIIVSSVVGALPAPWFATYAATKSFDLYFGEALHAECRGSGVDVVTVLPGLTKTEFQAGSGMRDYHSPFRSAEQVVQSTFSALGRKAIVVDGLMNKALVHGTRFLPRACVLLFTRIVMKYELRNR
jgi:short-subunit dehydrogenase